MPTFKHSGAMGDVIYALPAIRALGGGEIFVPVGPPSHFWNGFYGNPIPILRRLLEAQPYVTAVHPFEGQTVDYDLDVFRNFFGMANFPEPMSLCDMHLLVCGLPTSERDTAWITAETKPLPPGKTVVICRSSRYRSAFFNWKRVWAEYRDRAVFCGLDVEYREFQEQVGLIDRLPTADLYELAQYVSGCELFVGNQSSPFAVAEGLKVNVLQEVCPDCPNCIFIRPGAEYRTVY